MVSCNVSSDYEVYTRSIRNYPLITPEEEIRLANNFRKGDQEAGQKIIVSNLRFVIKVSRKYFHLGYTPIEIIQEGNMGLVKALTMFDPDRGVRFICYASWWIKAYINNFIQKGYKTNSGNLAHAKGLVSLDCSSSGDIDDEEKLLDHLLEEGPDQEDTYLRKEQRSFLFNLLSADPPILSHREVFILKERFLADPPATLKDVAAKIGVT